MAFISVLNPLLLWGGLAIASPIIIHLLSRRRFQELSWAAMDFLLKADRENRRRIRLEHLLLLILRCLLILLLVGMLARPVFDPSGLGVAGLRVGRREHVVLLDNSPSMGARENNRSLFDVARGELTTFLRNLAERRPQDSITLLLTSSPDRPIVRGASLSEIPTVVRRIEQLEVSRLSARMDDALLALEEELEATEGNLNHSVLIVSDFRTRDWLASTDGSEEEGPLAQLRDMCAQRTETTWRLADISGEMQRNVAVTAIDPPRGAVAMHVPGRFQVTVKNLGLVDVDDVEVVFSAGGTRPMRARIDTLAPGEEKTLPFSFTFQNTGPEKVQAEIGRDALAADNTRFFAAEVTEGARVLLVDGDPAARDFEAETFFLRRALSPPGQRRSGYVVDVISDSQLGDGDLDTYGMVVLANVFRVTTEQARLLRNYADAGGGLAMFLGDQIDTSAYNALHTSHPNLFPLTLQQIEGDPEEEEWERLEPVASNHPLLRVFSGDNNPLLARLKFFRWWGASIPENVASEVSLLARINDIDRSPTIVQSSVGDGRVMVFTFPADAEWSTWVGNPSYVVTMQEMARHVLRRMGGERQIVVGESIREAIDPSEFTLQAQLIRPDGESGGVLQAAPGEGENRMVFEYPETDDVGFYRLEREDRQGSPVPVMFAANILPSEGALEHLADEEFDELADAPNIAVSRDSISAGAGGAGNRIELWRPLLLAFVMVLAGEQLLGWYFGRRRQFR